MTEDAAAFVKGAKELPVMPPIAAEVSKKAADPESDLQDIAQLISRDAALTLRVLKIANSSFYSMPRKIESLQQAIVLLGYSTLRSVVVAASIKDVFARYGLAERLLWEHAVAAGCCASQISFRTAGIAAEDAFVAGLVHDVGKLVMHAEAEEKYQAVMSLVYSGAKQTTDAEREIFGFDHAQVGGLVLERWGLPSRLVAAVAGHHELELTEGVDGAKPLAAVLQMADLVCLREGMGRREPDVALDPLSCPGAQVLGLEGTDLEELIQAFKEAYAAEREIFG